MVSIGTFDWGSFKYIVKAPKSEAFVMLATVAVVVYTDNLAIGVVLGVILSSLFFVATISKVRIHQDNGTFIVEGPLFFASTQKFVQTLEAVKADIITIDLTSSHLWDESAVGAVVKVVTKLEEQGKTVKVIGMNPASEKLYNQLLNVSVSH